MFVISKNDLLNWVHDLASSKNVLAPVLNNRGETIFEKIHDHKQIHLNYQTTMVSPRKFIYPTRQDIKQPSLNEIQGKIIFGIHACDMHALSVLDKTFLGEFKDSYYAELREKTAIIVLNCNKACEKKYPNFILKGFCASMDSGPFLKLKKGYDIEITDIGKQQYLIETASKKGRELIAKSKKFKKALKKDISQKIKLKKSALVSFTKKLETKGLPELLAKTLDHPVYKQTADSRCLSCTNCTMVCPTCFCYNIEDNIAYDLKTAGRNRYWDSCQELNFGKVHDGNFREPRLARLRQFVTHKLSTWLEQYGCFGCVGCGRCMTWCPTNIDLTEMAKEIQKDFKEGKIK
ncbi:MAG: 4Fe-4S dicluster domain-containing protein [Proteobacteria bacterium]|nr:4Fe-4S dicluster domain-containing protein [Pseudomonadota bacterium]